MSDQKTITNNNIKHWLGKTFNNPDYIDNLKKF